MYTFLIALISILALLLILVILLQSGKGGGLAAEFGGASSSTESIIGGRQAATVLTKGTWVGGGAFIFLALVLAILSSRASTPPEPILRSEFGQPAAAAPSSVLETEALGGEQGSAQPGAATQEGTADGESSPGEPPPNE